jgi:hypothetical protein
MTPAGSENAANSGRAHESEGDAARAMGNIPAECGKILIWRLDLEPRHLIAEGHAYVSAIAYGSE